jgi:hypothetical protein
VNVDPESAHAEEGLDNAEKRDKQAEDAGAGAGARAGTEAAS